MVMTRAIEVSLEHILDGLLVDAQVHTNIYLHYPLIKFIVYSQIWYNVNLQDCMYKFQVTIEDILNK